MPPINYLGEEKSDLNLIKPLDLTTSLQEIQRIEEHVRGKIWRFCWPNPEYGKFYTNTNNLGSSTLTKMKRQKEGEKRRETETKKEKKNEKGKERDYLRTSNTFLLGKKLFLYPHSFSRRLYKFFLLI